ncbi:MAG: DUF1501 domain-containing protein [Planctomycetales bacterium]|nr:DUF1501 domain-containing protein [Planctomycetales bacterium]
MPTYNPSLETRPRDPQLWPFIGSIVDYVDSQSNNRSGPPLPRGEGLGVRASGTSSDGNAPSPQPSPEGRGSSSRELSPSIPRNIGLPWLLNVKTDLVPLAGPYASWLGQAYDPFWTEFDGPGTRRLPNLSDNQTREILCPYAGTTLEGRFRVAAASQLIDGISPDRLHRRRDLLGQFDDARRRLDAESRSSTLPSNSRTENFDRYRETAYSLLTSNRIHDALDISREPSAVRERYGLTLFGQSCLAARRLVEAGSKFVTAFWDGYGIFAGCAWDTHANHYPRLKEYLLPGFDRAYSALLLDLESRGMLDDTLILWLSEHGRTPKIDSKPKGAGRHHWSRAYSIAMAGGGTARGKVVGSTERDGGDVHDNPVSPKDILATTFHLLGIDAHTTVPNQEGRPFPIAGDGQVRPELFA